MKKRFDVVIVGAGIAGLGVASYLKDSGLKIAVLEKKKKFGVQDVDFKATFESTLRKHKLEQAIIRKYPRGFIFGPKAKSFFDLKHDPSNLVSYRKILEILKKRTKASFYFDIEIVDAKYAKDCLELADLKNNIYEAKLVVDASGRSSAIAQILGIERMKAYYKYYGFELTNCNIDPDTAGFFVDTRYSNSGGWVYPISKNKCQVAIGELMPLVESTHSDLRRNLLRSIKNYHTYELSKSKIVENTDFSVQYPVEAISTMALNRLIIIGDAAGQATPIMAEGLRPILDMSLIAADTVKQAFKKNNYSKRFLKQYEKQWWDNFGKYDFWAIILRHVAVKYFDNIQWDRAIESLHKLDTQMKFDFIKSRFGFSIIRRITRFVDTMRIIGLFLKIKIKKLNI
jgi:flavin-dependent dehydrogenase